MYSLYFDVQMQLGVVVVVETGTGGAFSRFPNKHRSDDF